MRLSHQSQQIVTTEDAEDLLERVFEAWNARDIPAMLRYFCDDLVFVEHSGQGGSEYKVRHGSKEFGNYLQTYHDVADCVSSLTYLTYDGIYVRTIIAFNVRHRTKNLEFTGRFRQVIKLRDGLISHLDEYHDVDASASFWDLVDAD